MRLQSQDETYEEEDFLDDEDAELDEAEQDTHAVPNSFFGIPRKIFIVGVLVVSVVLIVLVMLAIKKHNNKAVGGDPLDGADSAVVDSEEVGDNFYDLAGNPAGSVLGVYDGADVYDNSGNVIGTISSAGDLTAYDASGSVMFTYSEGSGSEAAVSDGSDAFTADSNEEVVFEDDNNSDGDVVFDDGTEESFVISDDTEIPSTTPTDNTGDEWVFDLNNSVKDFSLYDSLNTSDASKVLKSYGYTGDEIELAKQLNLSVEQLVSTAQGLMDENTAKSLERMSDHASKEFQLMYNYSQFSQPSVKFSPIDEWAESWVMTEGNFTVNADYEKVPIYGYQLKLKVKIANNTYVYMDVTPQHWQELADEGNIVVSVNYCLYGADKKSAHLYVTEITEVDTTTHTVNAEDSGSSLDDLVGSGTTTEEPTEPTEEGNGDDGIIWN